MWGHQSNMLMFCVVLGHGNISYIFKGHAYHHGNGSIVHQIIGAPTYDSRFAKRMEFHVLRALIHLMILCCTRSWEYLKQFDRACLSPWQWVHHSLHY